MAYCCIFESTYGERSPLSGSWKANGTSIKQKKAPYASVSQILSFCSQGSFWTRSKTRMASSGGRRCFDLAPSPMRYGQSKMYVWGTPSNLHQSGTKALGGECEDWRQTIPKEKCSEKQIQTWPRQGCFDGIMQTLPRANPLPNAGFGRRAKNTQQGSLCLLNVSTRRSSNRSVGHGQFGSQTRCPELIAFLIMGLKSTTTWVMIRGMLWSQT